MKKVLLVAFDFPPKRTSAVYRIAALTRYLTRSGWHPTVLTVETRKGDVEDPALLKKIPPEVTVEQTSYLRVTGWEGSAATAVRTVGGLKSRYDEARHRQPFFDRCLRRLADLVRSCLYFPDYSVGWIPFGFVKGAERHLRQHFDAIFTTSPPRSGPVIGLLLRLLFRVPWVLEFTDPWYRPKGPLRYWFERRLQGLMVRCADAVVVMTEGHAQELKQRFNLPDHKLAIIPNGFDEEDFAWLSGPRSEMEIFEPGYLHLAHFGAVYPNHSGSFFPALGELLRERPELKTQLRVHIIGYPDEAIRRHANEDGLREVTRIHPFLPHAQAVRAMRASDGLLVFLADRDFSRLAISSKIYEYLRVGRPIIAIAYPGGLTRLIDEARAGWVAPPDDAGAIRQVLVQFAEACLGKKPLPGLPCEFVAQFRWDRLAERLALTLDKVARHGC
jgi:glycosyltransferase involved in cell wall biosynthesis